MHLSDDSEGASEMRASNMINCAIVMIPEQLPRVCCESILRCGTERSVKINSAVCIYLRQIMERVVVECIS